MESVAISTTASEVHINTRETGSLGSSLRPRKSTRKIRKPSKSLFSISNAQSLSSQLNDTIFVLRCMVLTSRASASPSEFTKQYVLRPIFKNDLFVISFALPALAATPRILDAAPDVRSDASHWTYHGERTAVARKNLLNVASYNYLGFVDLEYNTRTLLERAVKEFPFGNDDRGCNDRLEEAVKEELREFMGFKGCGLTPSGYSINLVAFPAMASNARVGQKDNFTVFLMDSESHSSMFMGAFITCASGKGEVVKFRHNDVEDLTSKLATVYRHKPSRTPQCLQTANVWVAIEGLYSMDGTVPPLQEIAALKRKYGFRIYIDEAHSFLAIGSSGRGVVEHCCDNRDSNKFSIEMSDIDMIGGTISKAMSSVGGFVLSSIELEESVEGRIRDMQASRGSSIPTLSLIRTLQIIRKPDLVRRRLAHLKAISCYIVDTLEGKEYKIDATKGGPLVAIILDNVDRVSHFLRVGRDVGLICCGAAYPAAPRGAPRVRLSLTGAHSWRDVDEMLRLIDEIALKIGVKGLNITKVPNTLKLSLENDDTSSSCSNPAEETAYASHSEEVDAAILTICPPAVISRSLEAVAIRAAGTSALARYNLGASGPRWMCGTFSAHMCVEELLSSTMRKVIDSSIPPNHLSQQIQTTLFTDTRVGIMSVIATAMEGLTARRSKRGEKHLVLLPKQGGVEIKEGAAAAQPDGSMRTRWYDLDGHDDSAEDSLSSILTHAYITREKTHLTIYLDPELGKKQDEPKPMFHYLSSLRIFKDHPPLSMTFILNSTDILSTNPADTRAIISFLSSLFPGIFLANSSSTTYRFLLFGSFDALPYLPGLQGAFCTGSKYLVEKVQLLGQGVMYTCMMPPLTAALAEESIKTLSMDHPR